MSDKIRNDIVSTGINSSPDKKNIVPFAATLTTSLALNSSVGMGMPLIPPAMFDKLEALDGTLDIYGDKSR